MGLKYRELGQTGMKVSVIGFGASPLGDVFGATNAGEGQRAVAEAIELGINFFDVSPYYGMTLAETRLGEALQGRREKIFLATKCGRDGFREFDFSRSRTLASIDESLLRLRTDYVDLLQAHDIEFGSLRQIVDETIPALREVQRQGKARFIGITSYQLGMMARIAAEEPLDSVLSYCRFNLVADDLNSLLLPTVQRKAIGLINASPLHMGLLSGKTPPEWHPAGPELKKAALAFRELCKKHSMDPGQVSLRYCLDHPYAASTLVGMATAQEVKQNVGAIETEVDPQLMLEVERVFRGVKNMLWPSGLAENADHQVQI